MIDINGKVMKEGYSIGRILKRTLQAVSNRMSIDVAMSSFFTQMGLRGAYRQLYDQILKPSLS